MSFTGWIKRRLGKILLKREGIIKAWCEICEICKSTLQDGDLFYLAYAMGFADGTTSDYRPYSGAFLIYGINLARKEPSVKDLPRWKSTEGNVSICSSCWEEKADKWNYTGFDQICIPPEDASFQ